MFKFIGIYRACQSRKTWKWLHFTFILKRISFAMAAWINKLSSQVAQRLYRTFRWRPFTSQATGIQVPNTVQVRLNPPLIFFSQLNKKIIYYMHKVLISAIILNYCNVLRPFANLFKLLMYNQSENCIE